MWLLCLSLGLETERTFLVAGMHRKPTVDQVGALRIVARRHLKSALLSLRQRNFQGGGPYRGGR